MQANIGKKRGPTTLYSQNTPHSKAYTGLSLLCPITRTWGHHKYPAISGGGSFQHHGHIGSSSAASGTLAVKQWNLRGTLGVSTTCWSATNMSTSSHSVHVYLSIHIPAIVTTCSSWPVVVPWFAGSQSKYCWAQGTAFFPSYLISSVSLTTHMDKMGDALCRQWTLKLGGQAATSILQSHQGPYWPQHLEPPWDMAAPHKSPISPVLCDPDASPPSKGMESPCFDTSAKNAYGPWPFMEGWGDITKVLHSVGGKSQSCGVWGENNR